MQLSQGRYFFLIQRLSDWRHNFTTEHLEQFYLFMFMRVQNIYLLIFDNLYADFEINKELKITI